MLLYILAALLLLGILITIHEGGHFFAARLTGIPVKEFAIGFGPRLLSWKSRKHETTFFLRAIPAGGYCMFYGEDDIEGTEAKNDPRSFGNYPVWRRIVTVLMGPGMNFVLALAVAFALCWAVGEDTQGYYDYSCISAVSEGGPADQAGLLPGDVFLAVNGEDALGRDETGAKLKLSGLIDGFDPAQGPLRVTVRRGDEEMTVSVTPVYDAQYGRYMLGVNLNTGYHPFYTPVTPDRALYLAADYCVRAGGTILASLRDLITTGRGFEESAGPVGIVQLIAEETKRTGLAAYTELLVLISVNLGLFNLLPIPGLDGSRLAFLAVEGIRGKPIPRKWEAYVHTAGFMLLMGLMIVMTYKDLLRIFR